MSEAMIYAQRSEPQDCIEDAQRLVNWLSINIAKFRKLGAKGNHFAVKRFSHGPFGRKHNTGMPSLAN